MVVLIVAYTVNPAFKQFHENIKLNKSDSEIARSSRDNLFRNIDNFPKEDDMFPLLYRECHNKFGSFSRKTKINPLDDIDLLVCLNARGSKYSEHSVDNVDITVPEGVDSLQELSEGNILNSRKVIEKFKRNLKDLAHYKNAEINRRQEAITLSLQSYDWTFDIVPCFITAPTDNGRTYYLIPNREGSWKFTDPRIDQKRVTRINQENEGNILKIIRMFKHLAREYGLFKDNSYLLEVLILDYYEQYPFGGSFSANICKVLLHIKQSVQFFVKDPQDIRTNINKLGANEIEKIRSTLNDCFNLMLKAIEYESNGDNEAAINKWREIFGSKFPKYG